MKLRSLDIQIPLNKNRTQTVEEELNKLENLTNLEGLIHKKRILLLIYYTNIQKGWSTVAEQLEDNS